MVYTEICISNLRESTLLSVSLFHTFQQLYIIVRNDIN